MTQPPEPPSGFVDPEVLARPRWLLEGAGLVVLLVLAWLSRSYELLVGTDLVGLVTIIVAILALVLAHESVHFVASFALGYEPVIRWFPPRVYTADTWGDRDDGLLMLAGPILVLNVSGAIIWLVWSGWVATAGLGVITLNTAMSVGDLYVIGYLLAHDEETVTIVVEDEEGPNEYVSWPESE